MIFSWYFIFFGNILKISWRHWENSLPNKYCDIIIIFPKYHQYFLQWWPVQCTATVLISICWCFRFFSSNFPQGTPLGRRSARSWEIKVLQARGSFPPCLMVCLDCLILFNLALGWLMNDLGMGYFRCRSQNYGKAWSHFGQSSTSYKCFSNRDLLGNERWS